MRFAILAALGAALLAPAMPATAQSARERTVQAFLSAEQGGHRDRQSPTMGNQPGIHYNLAFADLNGDGRDEAIVYLMGEEICGSGGCTLELLTPAGHSWRRLAEITVTNAPIRLLATRRHGWRDLAVQVSGGGARAHEARLSFNGRHYADNPSVAPAVRAGTPGRVLITDDSPSISLF